MTKRDDQRAAYAAEEQNESACEGKSIEEVLLSVSELAALNRDNEIQSLKQQVVFMTERIAELEGQVRALSISLIGAAVDYDRIPYQMATEDCERLERFQHWYILDKKAVDDIATGDFEHWYETANEWMNYGRSLESKVKELEQLASEPIREFIESLRDEMVTVDENHGGKWHCRFCGGVQRCFGAGEYRHKDDCPWKNNTSS